MSRPTVRSAWLAAVVLASAACGSSTTSPGLFNLNLTPGDYFFGTGILAIPQSCGQFLTAEDVDMSSRVTLTRDGTDWVARSTTPADGTLELRVRGSAGVIINSAAPIGGTLRGTANHRDNATTAVQRTMTIPLIGDSATVSGTADDAREPLFLGTSPIALTFTRTAKGATVTCQLSTSLWVVQRK